MIRRLSLSIVSICALVAQASHASTTPRVPRPESTQQLPRDPTVVARSDLAGVARTMLLTRCELEQEIRSAAIPEDERLTLMDHARQLEEFLELYDDALRGPQSPASLLLAGIAADPLSARLGTLRIELGLVRLRAMIASETLRVQTLPDGEVSVELLHQLTSADDRLVAMRPSLADVESSSAFADLVLTFMPLLDEVIALSDRLDLIITAARGH